MFLFLVFTLVQMIFTASSEVWPKVKKFVSNFGTRPRKTFTQGLLCLPNQGGWEGQEEPYRVFSQSMGQDLQAGTLATQNAAHLTGTSPFHDLLGLLLPHAALCNRLEQLLNFWSAMNKLMVPELERWIFYQLNESNKETPGMRPIYNQSFQENPGDLLLDSFCVGLCKQVEHGAAEVVGVTVGVPQLVGDGIQEEVPAFSIQVYCQILEDVHVS